MKLDAHQHFWRYNTAEYPWIRPASPLARDHLPADLATIQSPLGFAGSIAVQARQTVAESDWLLGLADADPRIRGVVGWIDLQSDAVDQELERLSRHPSFVGVRHVVQDEPDDDFLLRPQFQRGLDRLSHYALTYDLLIFPEQLPAALQLVARLPEQRFVLDHLAKPFIKERRLEPWATHIRTLAREPHVFCKVSGLVTEADHQHWRPTDLRPYLDVAFEAFGPGRLMFGSDWPVCLLAAGYERVHAVVQDYVRRLDAADQAAFFGGTAERFYLRRDARLSSS
jgi:L-fuconolactonase